MLMVLTQKTNMGIQASRNSHPRTVFFQMRVLLIVGTKYEPLENQQISCLMSAPTKRGEHEQLRAADFS
jgi:hypothetical protein